jgi:hypothetical protein
MLCDPCDREFHRVSTIIQQGLTADSTSGAAAATAAIPDMEPAATAMLYESATSSPGREGFDSHLLMHFPDDAFGCCATFFPARSHGATSATARQQHAA